MSDKPSPKVKGQMEQLVAYLDGELNDEQTAAIEEQLRKDPKLRQMADDLDRTWGILDALEPVGASEEFSRQTMKTVAATGSELKQGAPGTFVRILSSMMSKQAVAWFGIGVLGTLCGLGVAELRGPSAESLQAEQLLRQFDVLQRYPEYSIVPSVDLLQQLDLPEADPAASPEVHR